MTNMIKETLFNHLQ